MLEPLEDRCLFSYVATTPVPTGISLSGGVVRVEGMQSDDTASVSVLNNKVHVTIYGWAWTATEKGLAPLVYISQTVDYDPGVVQSISFWGLAGNDRFTNNTSLPCWAGGGDGNDVLIGGTRADVLRGGNGADRLEGRAGDDSLYGEGGSDTHIGGSGSDYLFAKDGTVGNDLVFGDYQDGTGSHRSYDTAVVDGQVYSIGGSLFISRDAVNGVESISY
jgi:Ca2+-binding RTX toxin-like protein